MSSEPRPERQESVSWVVFQDDLAPRSFRISLASIERAGWLLGALVAALILALALSIRFFRLSRAPAPTGQAAEYAARLETSQDQNHSLEKELSRMKEELAQAKAAQASVQAATASAVPLPVPTQSQAPEPATAQVQAPTPVMAPIFSALPPNVASTPVPRESLPIELTAPTWNFKDKTLNLKFAIQYTRGDNGTQQGKIILLARGPSRIYAYPEGVLQTGPSNYLLEPARAEFFSVQRYREVIADFGPMLSREDIREVQIILLSLDGKVLVSDRVSPQWTHSTGSSSGNTPRKRQSLAPRTGDTETQSTNIEQ